MVQRRMTTWMPSADIVFWRRSGGGPLLDRLGTTAPAAMSMLRDV
jgi:hypothetical protein